MESEVGIFTVAVGPKFHPLAVDFCNKARESTPVPITIATNAEGVAALTPLLPENCNPINFEITPESNRVSRILLPFSTPYRKTLFLDVDSVVQHARALDPLLDLPPDSIALVPHTHIFTADHIRKGYVEYMKMVGHEPPLTIFTPSCFLIHTAPPSAKTSKLKNFACTWLDYFNRTGRRRDMPPFCCALKAHGLDKTATILPSDYWAYHRKKANAAVQHDSPSHWHRSQALKEKPRVRKILQDHDFWNLTKWS